MIPDGLHIEVMPAGRVRATSFLPAPPGTPSRVQVLDNTFEPAPKAAAKALLATPLSGERLRIAPPPYFRFRSPDLGSPRSLGDLCRNLQLVDGVCLHSVEIKDGLVFLDFST